MYKKDLLLKAAITGAAAAILANLTLYLINLLLIDGKTINMPQLSVEFFLAIDNYTLLHKIMGFIWSLVVGGAYAFVYLILLNKTGWNNLWIKAIIVVSGLWLFAGGFAFRVMEVGQYVRGEPLSVLAFFIAHLCFATYLYYFVRKLSV